MLSFIGSNGAAATTVTIPVHQAGDVILAFAYRDGSNTPPALPAGWTDLGNSGANTNSSRVAYRVATAPGTTSGTWTSATELLVIVYRGARTGSSPIGAVVGAGGNNNSVSYPALTLQFTDLRSWVIGVAGHRTATNVETAPAGMTNRVSIGTEAAAHDTAAGASAWNATSVTVNASSGWRSWSVEIIGVPPPAQFSGTANGAGNLTTASLTSAILGAGSAIANAAMTAVLAAAIVFGGAAQAEAGVTSSLTTAAEAAQFSGAASVAAEVASTTTTGIRFTGDAALGADVGSNIATAVAFAGSADAGAACAAQLQTAIAGAGSAAATSDVTTVLRSAIAGGGSAAAIADVQADVRTSIALAASEMWGAGAEATLTNGVRLSADSSSVGAAVGVELVTLVALSGASEVTADVAASLTLPGLAIACSGEAGIGASVAADLRATIVCSGDAAASVELGCLLQTAVIFQGSHASAVDIAANLTLAIACSGGAGISASVAADLRATILCGGDAAASVELGCLLQTAVIFQGSHASAVDIAATLLIAPAIRPEDWRIEAPARDFRVQAAIPLFALDAPARHFRVEARG